MPNWSLRPAHEYDAQRRRALAAMEKAKAAGDWPRPKHSEDDMLTLICKQGGFPVCKEVQLKGHRYGVLLNERTAVIATAVSIAA